MKKPVDGCISLNTLFFTSAFQNVTYCDFNSFVDASGQQKVRLCTLVTFIAVAESGLAQAIEPGNVRIQNAWNTRFSRNSFGESRFVPKAISLNTH